MKFLDKIKKWSPEKKRVFSLSLALLFTVLIIILNSGINILWPDTTRNQSFNDGSINKMQESFSQIVDQSQPILDQVFNSQIGSSTQSEEIIDQSNSTSSSFGTTSNIVE